MKTLEELIQENRWVTISCYEYLTEEFIEKHSDKVYWNYISVYQKLSEKFIEKHIDQFDLMYLLACQPLSHNFISKYRKNISQNYLSHNVHFDIGIKYNICNICNNIRFDLLNYNCNEYMMDKVLK